MGSMFADVIGFVATMLGGFAFRDELANASSFAWERVSAVWRKARLWYLHSVAAGAWWMLTIVGVLLALAHLVVSTRVSSITETHGMWENVQVGLALACFVLIVGFWAWLLPAKRIRDWGFINQSLDELKALGERFEQRKQEGADDQELDVIQQDIETKIGVFESEFQKRYGKERGPMLAILVTVFTPIVTGIGFCFMAAYLGTSGGAEWYEAAPIAGIGFLCYLLGEVMLRLFAGVLEVVLGDVGDGLNRMANAVFIRPGLLVLPFITEENYDKIMPKPIEVPFKQAAQTVKGTTLQLRGIFLTIIVWATLLPEITILGVVLFSAAMMYGIVVFHESRGMDPKSFIESSSRLHSWFMKAVMFFRIVQLVILALWHQWLSGSMIWNHMARWANHLVQTGGLNWSTVGYVALGGGMALFCASKMKDMKHPVMVNLFRGLTAFFTLLALLPLVGWGIRLGGVDVSLPIMPSSADVGATSSSSASAVAPATAAARPNDTITRMLAPEASASVAAPPSTASASLVTPTPAPTPVFAAAAASSPRLPVTTSVPEIPSAPTRPSERSEVTATRETGSTDRCADIRRATNLTDAFRTSLLRRYGCDS